MGADSGRACTGGEAGMAETPGGLAWGATDKVRQKPENQLLLSSIYMEATSLRFNVKNGGGLCVGGSAL